MAQNAFEQSMEKLEKTVRQLEGGDLNLEQSIAAFEEGMKLVGECEGKLKEAKGKIEKLVKDEADRSQTQPFETKE